MPRVGLSAIVCPFVILVAPVAADEPSAFKLLAREYEADARPLIERFCLSCHSAELREGELDLERFETFEQARRSPRVWRKVVEMLDNGEMPPKKKPQPSIAERARLREWSRRYLNETARAQAGDPGKVPPRRLSRVEYDHTVRDLTGVDLRPAREFPEDGAAGEGFTNAGEALAMSPALFDKYVAASKQIAAHAVLLPDGFRFSPSTTRRDWTDEIVSRIRRLYRDHTDPQGKTAVNLQGLTWDTNAGGRIPLEAYLSAALKYRDSGVPVGKSLDDYAANDRLSPKYLRIVWEWLNGRDPSPLADRIRDLWRRTRPADVPVLADEIRAWQTRLTKFNGVAHFKSWMEPIDPIVESQAIRVKPAARSGAKEVVLRLSIRDAGDGRTGDLVELRAPRLEAKGRSTILLRDLRDGLRAAEEKRRTFADVDRYLAAADEARERDRAVDLRSLAKERNLDPDMLAAWFEALGLIGRQDPAIGEPFVRKMENIGGYAFIKSWGFPETPSVTANSSDQEVRIPGTVKPHSVVVHPSPSRNVVVGWISPIEGRVRIEAEVQHSHPACGNGVSWVLEHRRGAGGRRLASGKLDLGKKAEIEPIDHLAVRRGDIVALPIGPRGTNHACDLTRVDLTLAEIGGDRRTWNLSKDVTPDIFSGNPHADSFGHSKVWYFAHEPPDGESFSTDAIPRGSSLDLWRDEPRREERAKLAERLRRLLLSPPASTDSGNDPDSLLKRRLESLEGPLLGRLDFARLALENKEAKPGETAKFGLPRSSFGRHRDQGETDDSGLFVQAPTTLEIRLPAELTKDREFVAEAILESAETGEGSVQIVATVDRPADQAGLISTEPILIRKSGAGRLRFEKSFAEFRRVFPAALCYAQIVPVDEVVTLVLFHRDDEALRRLVLNDSEIRRLDRLWDELRYVSQDALKVREAYGQFMEYVTQDGDVRQFEPLRKPISDRADALRRRLIETEPRHLDALVEFASKAYRRPTTPKESAGLRDLYANLRKRGLDHDAAFRLVLTRILVAPSFLYLVEIPAEDAKPQPVSDWEAACRLSYFLWSSMPDDELRRSAAAGKLGDPDELEAQANRLLQDDRARALATEFACQWLDVRGFDEHNEKSERIFPQFVALREAMYEESVRFFVDLFARDRSLLDVLDADRAFLNEPLAKFYGIPGVTGPAWREVSGVKARGRGGVLGMASVLAKQAGASRTSPVLRGNWLLESLLGEKLPKPPKNVPVLPESELETDGLTMRQLTEKHRSVEGCMKCHEKIDPFGFALEAFDAIGSRRETDLAGRPIDVRARLKDGTEFADIAGLRDYLLTKRRDEFVGQFCRKLLGYSLGRSVRLSDEPLLDEMRRRLGENGYRVRSAIATIVRSPQFRMRRGSKYDSDQDRDRDQDEP